MPRLLGQFLASTRGWAFVSSKGSGMRFSILLNAIARVTVADLTEYSFGQKASSRAAAA